MRRSVLFSILIVACMVAKAQFGVFQPVIPDYPRSTQRSTSSYGPFGVYQPVIPDYSRSTPIVPRNYGPFNTYTPSETVVRGTTYKATVLYESSTGHEEEYTLPVVVNNGSVDKIIFNDNGGCVHVGVNNSGYKYYGGKLEYIKEYDLHATQVTIVYPSDFWQKFTVIIE